MLIDGRDSPYITHRAQTESVTFLGNHSENTRNLYAIPGLDYVAHEDILPYTTSETNPLQHELFDKFLMYQEGRDPPYVAQVRQSQYWISELDVLGQLNEPSSEAVTFNFSSKSPVDSFNKFSPSNGSSGSILVHLFLNF